MPSPALILWADSTRNTFAAGWQSNLDAPSISLRQGDTIGVELHWVRRSTASGFVMEEVTWPVSANITLAVGRLDTAPTAGSFTLSYGSETTDELPYNATAEQVEAALNELTGIATDGGVSVTKTSTTYRIVWDVAGVPTSTIAVGANDLTPTASIGVAIARTGTVSVRQIVQLHIKQSPVAVCTSWVTQDVPAVTITEVHTPAFSGDLKIWRLKISPEPKSGSFRLSKTINGVTTSTSPISYNPLAVDIQTAIGLTTTPMGPYEWEISQPQITGDVDNNVSTITADDSGLVPYQSKYGVLSLNTLETELLLGGAATAAAYIEIEVEVDGTRETLVQKTATVVNDLIDTDSYTLVQWPDVLPADSVVRYDTSQVLTTPQKTQARTNIGALGSSDLAPFTTKDVELETRLEAVETLEGTIDNLNSVLTTNVKAALSGATTPSASNVFITQTNLSTSLAGYSQLGHSHIIGDVTGLQGALNAKAALAHTHTTADITGLSTDINAAVSAGLSGKSNVGHTHTTGEITGLTTTLNNLTSSVSNKANLVHSHIISDITGLSSELSGLDSRIDSLEGATTDLSNLPTTAEKQALGGSLETPGLLNPFVTENRLNTVITTTLFEEVNQNPAATGITGTYDNTNYPYEIVVKVNGLYWAIPARLYP